MVNKQFLDKEIKDYSKWLILKPRKRSTRKTRQLIKCVKTQKVFKSDSPKEDNGYLNACNMSDEISKEIKKIGNKRS